MFFILASLYEILDILWIHALHNYNNRSPMDVILWLFIIELHELYPRMYSINDLSTLLNFECYKSLSKLLLNGMHYERDIHCIRRYSLYINKWLFQNICTLKAFLQFSWSSVYGVDWDFLDILMLLCEWQSNLCISHNVQHI